MVSSSSGYVDKYKLNEVSSYSGCYNNAVYLK